MGKKELNHQQTIQRTQHLTEKTKDLVTRWEISGAQ